MINLLPPQEKEALAQEENWKLILLLEILALVFLIFLSLILFSVKFHLSAQLAPQKILEEIEEKKRIEIIRGIHYTMPK